MKNKKLSHNGLQGSVTSVMAALLCILIGLFVGFLVLLAINPAHAWEDGFVRILKGGFHDAPYGVGKELANAAPLIMTGLSVGFAFKTGLFNIGAAGQYTLGAYGALYCAIMLKLPWFVCLLAYKCSYADRGKRNGRSDRKRRRNYRRTGCLCKSFSDVG